MNQDGSDQKQVTVDPPVVEELRSSPGSRYLVYSAPQGRFGHLFRVNQDGTDPKQLTSGDSDEGDSSISNNGNWVVYDSVVFRDGQNDHTLWKVPTDGGDPVRLNRKNCLTPHFSPGGEFISCIENDETLTILSSDGAFIRSFPTIAVPALNIGARWTPDGKALAYLVFEKEATNIWLQPIDGKPARQLTDFTSGSTYNFAYSADGSRLYVARGQQIRDAILIRNLK
jgi:Tol biopolymer transport system component